MGSSVIHALHVLIYEEGNSVPVVEHVFRGRTRARAQGYFDSHLETDEFLRDCMAAGRWRKIKCRHVARWATEGKVRP
jgi:hypothetical protein